MVTLRRTAGVGLVIDSEFGFSTKNGVNQQETSTASDYTEDVTNSE
jgi:hypothetical protein